ncbi:MAG: hypothetical protein GOVbin1578_8 [Prokaryotic dsDNA virus sp.]|nr:MAG: hypothetical protein GOVbin1578_8 [Prokaryotic dsDNA virus sp.]
MNAKEIYKLCLLMQERKGSDYQNTNSSVKQIDYYPNGVKDIVCMMHTKLTRIRSCLDADFVNNESIEDSAYDLINYTTFLIMYLNYSFDGQTKDKDIFNNEIPGR